MELNQINPYIRAAMIQPAVVEGRGLRKAFDHRLFLVLAGEGALIVEHEEYPISPDSLMIFPPAFGYCFRGKMRMLVLNFDLTRVAEQRTVPICPPPAEAFDQHCIFDGETMEELPIPFVTRADEEIGMGLLGLVGNYDQENKIADALCSSELKRTLAMLLIRANRAASEKPLFERVKQYISLHAPQIESSEQIARHFGYHPVYLASVFRRETGESLHAAVLDARVSCARQWLATGNCSIDEIAYSAGFSSRSHFCTVFRNKTGMTPSEFRRKALYKDARCLQPSELTSLKTDSAESK